jgi:hypothetical protein
MTILEGICAVLSAAAVAGLVMWAGFTIESNNLKALDEKFPKPKDEQ